MAIKQQFYGFSTQNSDKTGVRTLYGIDLINVDLMHAFNTRIGERIMRPDHGCRLWDYVGEPLTDFTRELIIQEVTRICEADSRVVVINIQIFEKDHGFRIEPTLSYQPDNVIATFSADFQRNESIYFDGANSNF